MAYAREPFESPVRPGEPPSGSGDITARAARQRGGNHSGERGIPFTVPSVGIALTMGVPSACEPTWPTGTPTD